MTDNNRRNRDIQAAPTAAPSTEQAGPDLVKGLIAAMSIVVLIISGYGYFTIGRLGNDLASAQNLGLGDGQNGGLDGAVDILLVGADARTDAQGNALSQETLDRLHAGTDDGEFNTDTIMVVRIPADGTRATAASIPRDTYVSDDEFGNLKINGVYGTHKAQKRSELVAQGEQDEQTLEQESSEAGRAALLDTIADLTGVEIDHYAEIGLHGFVELTNAVGGVDVCLNEPVDDPLSGAQFPAGEQTLDGFEALSFVRQRHGLPRGDLDRIVRQQAFMASLINNVLSAGTLTNPSKLSNMAGAVESSVIIDEDWDVVSFATQLGNLAGGNVTFETIPVTSTDGVGDYGESIVTVDPAQVQAYFEGMLEEEEETPAPAPESMPEAPDVENTLPAELENKEFHVLNAGTTSGRASGVAGWLQEQGARVESASNAQPGIYTYSQVVANDPTSPAAKELAQLLGGLPITANAGLDDDSLVVVAHEDYTGPLSEDAQFEDHNEVLDPEDSIGTPGTDFGVAEVGPEMDAGGTGLRCVN